MLANAAGTPIWAKLSDIWGRKPALLGAVLLFTVGSVIAATSIDMPMLISGRAVQGTAAGGITSLVSITISDLFSVRKRSLYLAVAELVWITAGATGPVLGGALTEKANWRWNFYINLPVCGLSLILLFFYLNVHNPRTALITGLVAIDWLGTLSILAVTLMVLLGLDFGGATFAWSSPQVISLIVVGIALIGFFIFSEKKLAKYPIMPLHILRNKSTVAVLALVGCVGIVQMGTEYYMPLYFQSVRGASPLRSGVLILPLILLTASGGVLSGIILHHFGRYRELIWAATALLTLGMGLYIQLGLDTTLAAIVGFQILEGFGAGLLFQPPLVAVQAAVTQADTASATATLAFVRNIANSLGLVLGGVVFQNSMDTQAAPLRAAGLDEKLVAAFSSSSAAANVDTINTIADKVQRDAVRMAYSASLRNTFIMFTAFGGLALVFSAFIKHRDLSRDHTETRTGLEELSKRQ